MSRTPVREAFLRLEAEGLLRLFPKRGALVVPVSPAEVEAVLEARELVEGHAVAKLCAARNCWARESEQGHGSSVPVDSPVLAGL